eukprot:scaffold913_cov233-Pinguiococcus_pyrenoidosus.AAC.7
MDCASRLPYAFLDFLEPTSLKALFRDAWASRLVEQRGEAGGFEGIKGRVEELLGEVGAGEPSHRGEKRRLLAHLARELPKRHAQEATGIVHHEVIEDGAGQRHFKGDGQAIRDRCQTLVKGQEHASGGAQRAQHDGAHERDRVELGRAEHLGGRSDGGAAADGSEQIRPQIERQPQRLVVLHPAPDRREMRENPRENGQEEQDVVVQVHRRLAQDHGHQGPPSEHREEAADDGLHPTGAGALGGRASVHEHEAEGAEEARRVVLESDHLEQPPIRGLQIHEDLVHAHVTHSRFGRLLRAQNRRASGAPHRNAHAGYRYGCIQSSTNIDPEFKSRRTSIDTVM